MRIKNILIIKKMAYITDKEIANLLGISEKSYIYQSKTKERIDKVLNEVEKRIENAHYKEIEMLKNEIIKHIKSL